VIKIFGALAVGSWLVAGLFVGAVHAQAPAPAPGTGGAPAPGPGAPPPLGSTPSPEKPAPTPAEEVKPVVPVIPDSVLGPVVVAPFVRPGPDFLNQAVQGPLTILGTFTISEQYNDNIFVDNANRKHDFITGFTPGLQLLLRKPTYGLTAGGNFTAQIYALETQLSSAAGNANLFADGLYRLTPTVSLTLNETFVYSQNSNFGSALNVATGRQNVYNNTITPGLTWKVAPLTDVRAFASYQLERLENGPNSNIYRAGGAVDHTFTPRLTGTVLYAFGFFDVEGEDNLYTNALPFGLTYRFTPTLTGSVSAGPNFIFSGGETGVSPVGSVGLTQEFKFGSLSASYLRTVSESSGLEGVTNNDIFGGTLRVRPLRDLFLQLSPQFTRSKDNPISTDTVDVKNLTINVSATYQFARNFSLVASYTYYQQWSNTPNNPDVNQNLVTVGIQYGYPFNFE
jgi:hypothetical protein